LELARRGHRVTVVDRRYVIGDKLCSGIVGAECLRRFPAKDSDIYRSASSAAVHGPSGRRLVLTRDEPQAYVLNRVAYVADFARRAQDAGATYLLGHTLHSLTVQQDGVTAVVANGAGPQELRARAAVIASGFGSRLTRMAGLGQVRDFVIGVQGEVEAPSVEGIELYLGRQLAPGFFAWLVPTSSGRAHLGLLSRRDGARHFRRLLARMRELGKVTALVKPPTRWGIPLRPMSRSFGHRVLAAGDAAGQVKPATGGGIYYSLLSSQIAAETLHEALDAGDLSESRLSRYEREWKRLLGQELRIGYGARRLFERMGDSQVDYLLSALADGEAQSTLRQGPGASFDWHAGIIQTFMRLPVVQHALDVMGLGMAKMRMRSR